MWVLFPSNSKGTNSFFVTFDILFAVTENGNMSLIYYPGPDPWSI